MSGKAAGCFGVGIGRLPNGATYRGDLHGGKPHGQGVLTFPNDAGRYVGEFLHGLPHGQGTLTFQSGEHHEGEFRGGKANGKGVRTFPNGSVYECEWRDGRMAGQGVLTTSDGTRFEGTFVEGKFIVPGRGLTGRPSPRIPVPAGDVGGTRRRFRRDCGGWPGHGLTGARLRERVRRRQRESRESTTGGSR